MQLCLDTSEISRFPFYMSAMQYNMSQRASASAVLRNYRGRNGERKREREEKRKRAHGVSLALN